MEETISIHVNTTCFISSFLITLISGLLGNSTAKPHYITTSNMMNWSCFILFISTIFFSRNAQRLWMEIQKYKPLNSHKTCQPRLLLINVFLCPQRLVRGRWTPSTRPTHTSGAGCRSSTTRSGAVRTTRRPLYRTASAPASSSSPALSVVTFARHVECE